MIESHIGQRHLMRAKRSFYRQAINDLWPRPPFQTAEHNGPPTWSLRKARCPCLGLNGSDFCTASLERCRERLMQEQGIVALHKVNVIPLCLKELLDIFISISAQYEPSSGPVSASPSPTTATT